MHPARLFEYLAERMCFAPLQQKRKYRQCTGRSEDHKKRLKLRQNLRRIRCGLRSPLSNSNCHANKQYQLCWVPNIKGQYNFFFGAASGITNGSFSYVQDDITPESAQVQHSAAGNHRQMALVYDAASSNGLYGASSTVQPLATACQYLIKY